MHPDQLYTIHKLEHVERLREARRQHQVMMARETTRARVQRANQVWNWLSTKLRTNAKQTPAQELG
jgi:hypothetical protein